MDLIRAPELLRVCERFDSERDLAFTTVGEKTLITSTRDPVSEIVVRFAQFKMTTPVKPIGRIRISTEEQNSVVRKSLARTT